jgi:CubicO group peptidase (beta-lactamase class C family)
MYGVRGGLDRGGVIVGAERLPESAGMDPAALERAVGLIEARGAIAQVCVLRHGQVVLDRAFGCGHDSLFLIFSAGKPLVAVLVHLLAERGLLDLDDPVARYWPEFGRRGKQAITIRQVLQHRAGLPVAHNLPRDALAAPHWQRAVHGLELARPSSPPGEVPAYHILSFGFILGEVVQRVTGADLREVMAAELFEPLGLADTYLGLPAPLWHRHVPVRGHGPVTLARQVVFNRRGVRAAVVPAATVSATARDLARFYEMLLRGGEAGGVRILRPETVARATRPSANGQTDRLLRLPVRWSEGFQLGGPGPDPRRPRPMGAASSPGAFGHNGSNCCLAWADPSRDVVFAYLTNRLTASFDGSPHMSEVSDAVLAACR